MEEPDPDSPDPAAGGGVPDDESEFAAAIGGSVYQIPSDKLADCDAYLTAAAAVQNAVGRGAIKPIDAQRHMAMLAENCLSFTGTALKDVAREKIDPITRFAGLMESGAAELLQVEAAIRRIDDLRASEALKKNWNGLIRRTIALQKLAREDGAKFAVYVDRNDEPDRTEDVLLMEWFHVYWFGIWEDPEHPCNLIEAPVGHGKSKLKRLHRCWRIGNHPEARCLYLTDETSKARKTIQVMRKVIRSERFVAVFPGVRVLGRNDDSENSSLRFTVIRRNWASREPTVEGAAITSRIQGNRYDEIDADDFVPPDARDYESVRRDVNHRWESVVMARRANPKARVNIIGTPWHIDDTYARIEKQAEQGRKGDWRVEIEPFRIRDDSDGVAIALWSKWPSAFLEGRKIAGRDYDFNYRLQPASESTRIVKRVMFYSAEPGLNEPNGLRLVEQIAQAERWLSVDPAGTSGEKSSNTGVVEIAISPAGYVFVTDCWLYRTNITEVITRLGDLVLARMDVPYEGVHWEAQGGIKVGMPAVLSEFRRYLTERGYDAESLKLVTTGTRVGGEVRNRSKIVRLKNCASLIEHGLVRFAGVRTENRLMPMGHPRRFYYDARPNSSIGRLVQNIKDFDGVHSTDAVDALTQWILHNQGRIRNPFAPAAEAAPTLEEPTGLTALFRQQLKLLEKTEKPTAGAEENRFLYGRFGSELLERIA
uniref:Putative terminase n=1 Tax=viral metagenome TaxID=1070528 RepID=A0A6H1ZGY0_9ZZZZ